MTVLNRVFAVCVLVCVCLRGALGVNLTDSQYLGLFAHFVSKFEKSYETGDLERRFQTFKGNLGYIMQFNMEKHTHTLGVNQFADMEESEWSLYKGFPSDKLDLVPNANEMLKAQAQLDPVPMLGDDSDYIDWRAVPHVVNPILNQGKCGSCYSYSAVSTIESAYALKTGNLMQGSVQQPVDCCQNDRKITCSTCNGGFMTGVYYWAHATGGICLDSTYPYVAKKQACKACSRVLKIAGHYNLQGLPESYIRKAIKVNPVSIGLMSNSRGFMFYKSGVITANCGRKADHAVVIVGLEKTTDDMDAYIVRNSWGSSWGENGYVRIQYGKNMCGILIHPAYPAQPTDEQLSSKNE